MGRRIAAGILGLFLWATAGCSDAPAVSGSLEESTVKGVVRVQGKPVKGGMVTFRPSNVNRPDAPVKEGPIGPDGTYSVSTLVGQNFVEVSCKELLTPRNRPFLENEQLVEVPSGGTVLDIDIPPTPRPPSD